MIRHFAADGSVKREWAEGLYASAAVRDGKVLMQIQGSNAVLAEIELADGEQLGETFIPVEIPAEISSDLLLDRLKSAGVTPAPIPSPLSSLLDNTPASAQVAADVHPIESALSAPIVDTKNLSQEEIDAQVKWDKEHPTQEEQERAKAEAGTATEPYTPPAIAAVPVAIMEPILVAPALEGSTTEHHVPSPSEIVETAAHALSDAAAVLKAEEAHTASGAGAEK